MFYNQKNYYAGIYNYVDRTWKAKTTAEYFFIENISQVQGGSYDLINAPENTRATDDSGDLLFIEEGNVWLDNGEYIENQNKNLLNNRWFLCYLVVNNEDDTETVNSTMEINQNRV